MFRFKKMKTKKWDKVKKGSVDFQEVVKDFTGLIFHCPNCDAEFHLHIAEIDFQPIKINKIKTKNAKTN